MDVFDEENLFEFANVDAKKQDTKPAEAPLKTIEDLANDSKTEILDDIQLKKRKHSELEAQVQQQIENNTPKTEMQTDGTSEQQEQIVVHVVSREDCLHEVSIPPEYKGPNPLEIINEPIQREPAKTYPFVLDAFQRESVKCIEKGHSVLVSAHTSAGKTAIAEYAIALSLKNGSRVIYTSPIKALSNQKYRELSEEFKDVGLMTGDVTINPNSSCLVMTTEILRSMLYRGSEILHEVAWVIFDEVHYMRDRERGVVWEETMILLPSTVKYVFLSATIPNALEFTGWIAKLKSQPVHVVYTDYRPTPLQHYIYPLGGEGIHLIVDEKGRFKSENFQKAVAVLQQFKESKKRLKQSSDIYKIVKMIMEKSYQPVIVFSFSRKDCENYAMEMSKLDLNDEEEKKLVAEVFNNAVSSLGEEDRKLPQVEQMLPLLKRGIGIHHSGLLPIIKEVIEILFQEGLLKALFSTETFSMGLNMPARTVVFTQLTKFDGTEIRYITSGEYIQMSGRAGRRGLDDRGIVILMIGNSTDRSKQSNTEFDEVTAKQMMSGKADALNSSFHLSYFMVLNLLRVEEITPEYIMERSFYQFQKEKQKPAIESSYKQKKESYEKLEPMGTPQEILQLANYFEMKLECEKLKQEMRAYINKPMYCLNFLQPGRMVKLKDVQDDWGWGIILNFAKKPNRAENIASLKATDFVADVMVKVQINLDKQNKNTKPKPAQEGEPYEMAIVPMQFNLIEAISSVRVFVNQNLHTDAAKEAMKIRLNETLKRFPQGLPLIDPISDMKIDNDKLKEVVKKLAVLEGKLASNPQHKNPKLEELLKEFQKRKNEEEEIEALKKQLESMNKIVFIDELKKMMRVLRRLGHTNEDNLLQSKGRVACEISSSDELVLTEMMLNGDFNNLTPEQCVALVSCFTHDDSGYAKDKSSFKLPPELQPILKAIQTAATKVGTVMIECKIELDLEEYVDGFVPTLMEVTYAWCRGAQFVEIMKLTSEFEGSIIRAMRRMEELLRQLCAAAKSVGDTNLEQKFLEGMSKLKRDIVFSSSLYL